MFIQPEIVARSS